ncbi:chromatin accessibility complex protein 1 [Chironomus tepperi]|uniref:chromatin accessibility complex protein 1 n=1 Tax=Chironomus tepperi TaxID=113505 RepID=UPI00391F54C9
MAGEDTKTADTSDDKRRSIGNGKIRYTDNILPIARIKKIMKMDPNITDNIANEATYLITSATEHFIRYLAKEAYNLDKKALSYKSLAQYVQDEEKLDFLHQIIPHKITVRQYKKILKEDKDKVFDSGSDVSSSSEEEEEEEEEEQEDEEVSGEEESEEDEK